MGTRALLRAPTLESRVESSLPLPLPLLEGASLDPGLAPSPAHFRAEGAPILTPGPTLGSVSPKRCCRNSPVRRTNGALQRSDSRGPSRRCDPFRALLLRNYLWNSLLWGCGGARTACPDPAGSSFLLFFRLGIRSGALHFRACPV